MTYEIPSHAIVAHWVKLAEAKKKRETPEPPYHESRILDDPERH